MKSASDTVTLRFYGDVHWSAKSCDRDKFNAFLSSDRPNCYYLSLGDDLNCIPHDDKRFRVSEIDPWFMSQGTSVIDAEVKDYVNTWKKHKIPSERHLGVLEGNHPLKQTSFGMNPVAYMCGELKIPHLAEYSAVVPVIFSLKGNTTILLTIIIHHGWGGTNSRQKGSDWNKYTAYCKSNYDNWDIAVFGHTHNFGCLPDTIMDCNTKTDFVKEKIVLVGIAGTFLKTIEHETQTIKGSSYSERGGYPPRVISWLEIDVGFKRLDSNANYGLRYPHIVPSL